MLLRNQKRCATVAPGVGSHGDSDFWMLLSVAERPVGKGNLKKRPSNCDDSECGK
jgi:hypothetical protein